MLFVGIDPGEQWCGVAVLDTTVTGSRRARAESRVYAIKRWKNRKRGTYISFVDHLMDILPHVRQTAVIVEDYRVRATGHQRFSRADTLRLIGALEYAVHRVPTFAWHMIAPGPETETRLLFGPTIEHYRKARWPNAGDARWKHCLSAWRVLGRHMVLYHTADLQDLRSKRLARSLHSVSRWLPTARWPQDLVAPAVAWKTDQKRAGRASGP